MVLAEAQMEKKNKKTQTAYEPPSVKVKKIKSNINDKEENKKNKTDRRTVKKRIN